MQNAIPDDLVGVPTGPELCALLAPVELGAVPDNQLGDLLRAHDRQLAYQQAQAWAVMNEIAQSDPMLNSQPGKRWTRGEIFESAVDEVRAELRLTRRAASRELVNATAVAAQPRVFEAL